ncbi:hypothetical protein LENED_011263 [Lentinula edodes]|uniref:Uncharacterized protein n=1 Tax=Lentinula edodes TaxID=5353 RepID=A0A1Q3EPK5_LENED|nr:hypothetical protein LENED_011263 [Lentinula edodes]
MGKSAEMMRGVRLVVANVDIEGSNARYGFGPYSSSAFGNLLNLVYISAATYHNLLCSPFTSELFTLDMPTICETRFFLLPAPPQPLTSAPSADPVVASQLDPIATNQLPNPDYPPPLSPSPLPAPLHLLIFQQVSLQKKRRMLRVTLEKLWAIVWLKTVGLPCPFRVREYKECAAKKCLCLLLLIRQPKTLAKQCGVYDTALRVPHRATKKGGDVYIFFLCRIIVPNLQVVNCGELTKTPADVMFGLRTDVFCLMCSWIPVNVRRICICLHSVLNSCSQ